MRGDKGTKKDEVNGSGERMIDDAGKVDSKDRIEGREKKIYSLSQQSLRRRESIFIFCLSIEGLVIPYKVLTCTNSS